MIFKGFFRGSYCGSLVLAWASGSGYHKIILLLPYIQLFAIRHIQSTDRKKGGWICRTGEVDGAMKFSAKGKPTERCQYGQEHADRT